MLICAVTPEIWPRILEGVGRWKDKREAVAMSFFFEGEKYRKRRVVK